MMQTIRCLSLLPVARGVDLSLSRSEHDLSSLNGPPLVLRILPEILSCFLLGSEWILNLTHDTKRCPYVVSSHACSSKFLHFESTNARLGTGPQPSAGRPGPGRGARRPAARNLVVPQIRSRAGSRKDPRAGGWLGKGRHLSAREDLDPSQSRARRHKE